MKRSTALVAIPLVAGSMTLSACGGSATETTTTSAATVAASSAGTSAATASATPVNCPTENTKAFAKTRFVADLGLAAGTFHRYIYKPYQAGSFKQGADGRTMALVKAGATAALDYKLVSNAYDNAMANPTLCKAIGGPLGQLKDTMNTMKGQITKGDLSSIAGAEAILGSVLGGAQKQGLTINETTDESAAK